MLPLLFFFIALFYAMVGFGGGSSYLAVLVLAGLPYHQVPVIALTCNLIVTLGGCWHFYRAGHLKIKTVIPFMVTSIPAAYWGGTLLIDKKVFCLLLGGSLLAVALRMFLRSASFENPREVSWRSTWVLGVPLGGVLGFLAGVVGIGGGIFLSPILLLLRWTHIKEAAAAASLFIVVNSAAGLLGQVQKGVMDLSMLAPLCLAVLVGGQIGSRLGAYRIPKTRLQQVLGVMVLAASAKLLLEVL